MITSQQIEKALSKVKKKQSNGYRLKCPKCGRNHGTHQLSLIVDVYICDLCASFEQRYPNTYGGSYFPLEKWDFVQQIPETPSRATLIECECEGGRCRS